MDIEDLRRRRQKLSQKSSQTLDNMNKITQESLRVADVAHNSRNILDDLDHQFESQTGLNKVDISFLFFATALQCFRQYFLTDFKQRFNDKVSAKDSDKIEKNVFDRFFDNENTGDESKKYYASLNDIISKGVPYDANWGSGAFNLGGEGKGLSGKNHRFRTLGHDPLLGWIFGTANIMTNTLTDWKFLSYHVKTMPMADRRPMFKIVQNASTGLMFDKIWDRAKSEPQVLAAALIKQGLHLKSDEYSTVGLPVPVISMISPDFAQKLAEYGVDMGNLMTVGKQASMAILINTIIAMIHGLLYDESKCSSWDLYEVKTRKILSYSNLIASASNIVYVVFSQNVNKLDIGGLMVTIYRLVTDKKFIQEVKEEFVFGGFDKLIQGEEYNF